MVSKSIPCFSKFGALLAGPNSKSIRSDPSRYNNYTFSAIQCPSPSGPALGVVQPGDACGSLGLMSAASDFRSRLVAREPVYGAWSMLSSPVSVRLLAAAGLDYVVIDLQHGTATEHDLPGLTDAIRLAGAVPVARVRHPHPADIGRALDLGCAGVIVPNVNSAAQAREAAGACRYPPAGYR